MELRNILRIVFALRDRDDLKVTFTLLGVKAEDLKVYNDLTDTQMREKIEAIAKMADARPDCAWVSVVILSHGRQKLGEDEIMGVNGEGLKKSDVSGHNEKRFRYLIF